MFINGRSCSRQLLPVARAGGPQSVALSCQGCACGRADIRVPRPSSASDTVVGMKVPYDPYVVPVGTDFFDVSRSRFG